MHSLIYLFKIQIHHLAFNVDFVISILIMVFSLSINDFKFKVTELELS